MADNDEAVQLYLDLMKRCLTRSILGDGLESVLARPGAIPAPLRPLLRAVSWLLSKKSVVLARESRSSREQRAEGRDWPPDAETMVGLKRLDSLEWCVKEVLRDDVPGDLIEAGVWRGGAVIFMRAILKAYGVRDRKVYAADSFQGLPPPDVERYPRDAGSRLWAAEYLRVGAEQVRANFAKYGLLDDQVVLLEGWFKDTLPNAPIERLAVMRLDGDMYESTIEALAHLYPKLAPGGFCIIDDYGAVEACREAVEDYRREHRISEPLEEIDWTGRFWRKARA